MVDMPAERIEIPPRRCVVTGGAGFIGSHLVDVLLASGHEVVAVDNLSTGSTRNIDHLFREPRFRFVECDVSRREEMAPIVADCDDLFHLASYVGVKLASQTSSQTILNNLRSIDTILDLVTEHRPRFLLTSTSEIYGKALDRPGVVDGDALDEQSDRVYGATEVHRWSYAGIKAVEEFLTLAKHHEEGLHTVIVRLFNVIGPRQIGRHGPVVPRFIEQAVAGEPITIYGDGEQRRCFTYVGDAVEAILMLIGRSDASGQVFNIGGAGPVSVRELAEIIIRLSDSDSKIRFVPYNAAFGDRFEDVNVRVPDTLKLEALTGFRADTPLEAALRLTVASHPSRSMQV